MKITNRDTPSAAVVVGAAGQLGAVMTRRLAARGPVHAFTRAELDLTDNDAVMRLVTGASPGVIVNCAAYNKVDGAEDDVRGAFAVNAFAVDSLARAARATGATLVHYSTDFVFDGRSEEPYTETDVPQPQSVYGQSKLVGEWMAAAAPASYVLRVASLFGGNATASVDKLIGQIRDGQPAPAFEDRTVTPSLVDDVAEATVHLLESRAAHGTYHVVSTGHTTWYEMGVEIARRLGRPAGAVTATRMAGMEMRAPRPLHAALSNRRLTEAGFAMPTWQAMLDAYLPRATR